MLESRPESLDEYIKKMRDQQVKVIPSINKSNQLEGFGFEYKGVNLKGHRSMSGNKKKLDEIMELMADEMQDFKEGLLQLKKVTDELQTGAFL